MTRRQGKTEATDMEGLLGQDEAFIGTRVKTALREVLEAGMVEAVGAARPPAP